MAAEPADLSKFINVNDFEDYAKSILPKMVVGYYASGAETETALRNNRHSLESLRLMPRMLVDCSRPSTRCTLLGSQLSAPILVAPMAMQRMAHPEGELATVEAAVGSGTIMGVSTMGTTSLEEIADHTRALVGPAAPLPLWFQLYVLRDRPVVEDMVREAERKGYRALVLTVDAPRLGKREADQRNGFGLPPGLRLQNLERLARARPQQGGAGPSGGAAAQASVGKAVAELAHPAASEIARTFVDQVNPGLTWRETIPWLRSITSLPLLVKGVLHPDDALRAVEAGCAGIVVSNHGGRQLDFAPSAVQMLPAIVRAVGGRVPIIVDGGIRRGTDVLKCLALGADAVLVGRPVLWGLAAGGAAGAKRVLEILRTELELAMQLCGTPTLADITSDLVWAQPGWELQPLVSRPRGFGGPSPSGKQWRPQEAPSARLSASTTTDPVRTSMPSGSCSAEAPCGGVGACTCKASVASSADRHAAGQTVIWARDVDRQLSGRHATSAPASSTTGRQVRDVGGMVPGSSGLAVATFVQSKL